MTGRVVWQLPSLANGLRHRTCDDDLDATATCFFRMFEHEVRCTVGGNNFLFVGDAEVVEDFSSFCMVAQSDFEPMIMEITGFSHNFSFFFLIMVLGGGDGSKPSVSFLNFEPKVSKVSPTRTDAVLVFSPRRPLSCLATSSPYKLFTIFTLSPCLPISVTVEEAFCVLFVEFVVDNVLAVFDGVCCCDKHVDTSCRLKEGLVHFSEFGTGIVSDDVTLCLGWKFDPFS